MAFFNHPTLSATEVARVVYGLYPQEVYVERVGQSLVIRATDINHVLRHGVFIGGELFEVTPLTKWNHPRDALIREAYRRKLQEDLDAEAAAMDADTRMNRPRLERSVAVPYKEVWGTTDGSP